MSEKISCPNCDFEFELSNALSIELRKKLEQDFAKERKEHSEQIKKQEAKLKEEQEQLEAARGEIEKTLEARLKAQRDALEKELQEKARESLSSEMKSLQEDLSASKQKLKESQEFELQLRKQQAALVEKQESMALEMARKEAELKQKMEADIRKRLTEEHQLKLADQNHLIASLRERITDLQKRSEQGSQQAQGESLELDLEERLGAQFPLDSFTPVGKGVRGSDCIQEVRDQLSNAAGSIIWEFKRTKNWDGKWLEKLRDDQRAAKADIAVIVSDALPKEVTTFALIDSVWVCSISCATALAAALRETLLRTARARRANEGAQGKMELLYNYLAGPEFRQRLEGIAETFQNLQEDLNKEKRAMQKIWSKREKQLERAVLSAGGLHGDLQGIIGSSLEEIEYFSLEAIGSLYTVNTKD